MAQKRKCCRQENEESPPLQSSCQATDPASSTASAISSSFSKTVSLDDWWLIKSCIAYNGKRLAVGGKVVQGNHEVRFFTSAPIVKRYDAFTVETVDGVTLTFHGFINKPRAHQNGIPPEVSHFFLFGFPYNWECYADGDFGSKVIFTAIPTSSSNNDEPLEQSSHDVGRVFPIRVSFKQLLDALTSSPDTFSIDDVLRRQFNSPPRESNGSIPMDAALPASSDITNCQMVNTSLYVETLGRHKMDNNNQNNKHIERCARRIDHDSVGNAMDHAEEASCSSNELHGVHCESSEIEHAVIRNHCSSLTVDKNCEKQDEAQQGFLTDPVQWKGVELEKNDNLAKHMAANSNMVAHMPDNRGELNDESTTNAVDLIIDNVINASSPKEQKGLHLQQHNQQENYATKPQNHAEKTRVQDVGVPEDLQLRKYSVGMASVSLIGNMNLTSETLFESPLGGAQRNGDNESTPNSAGLTVKDASNGLSSSIRSLLHENRRRKLRGYTLSQCHAKRIRVQPLDDSVVLAARKVTNRTEADSLPTMTGIVLETAVKLSPNVKERKLIDKLTMNSADSAIARASDNLLPTEGDELHHKPGRTRRGYALRSLRHVGKTGAGSTGISEESLEKKDSECDMNSISVEMNVPFETLPNIYAGNVCKASKKKASQGDNNLSRAKGKTMHEFQSPLTQGKTKKLSVTSPELLNLKRSRSGRVLDPPIDTCRQQGIIYDMVGSTVAITGINTLNSPCKGSKSGPPIKKRKLRK